MNPLPFRTLLYRYFFFDWLFRDFDDGCVGNAFARAAVARYNYRQAGWLPVYIRRWATCCGLLFATAVVLEGLFEAPGAAGWLYALAGMCMSASVTATTAWVGLRQRAR